MAASSSSTPSHAGRRWTRSMRVMDTLDSAWASDVLSTMPHEVLETMMQFLDEPALCSMANVNRTLLHLVRHADELWQNRYAQLWQGRRLHDPLCTPLGKVRLPAAALSRIGAPSWQEACMRRRSQDVVMLRNWGSGRHRVREFVGHENEVFCLMRKGNLLLTGSQDSTIRVWDVHSGDLLDRWTRHESWVSCLALDAQRPNTVYSGAHDGTVRTWDMEKLQMASMIPFDALCVQHGYIEGATGNHRYILSIEPLPTEVCSATYLVGTMDRVVRVVDMRQPRVVGTLTGHNSYVSCLVPVEGTHEIYTGSGDTQIRQWDARTMRCTDIRSFHTLPVTCIRLRDGELISSSEDGRLKYWRQNIVHHSSNHNELWGFDMNERVLVAGCECGRLEVRDAVDGRLRYVVNGHGGPVGSVYLEDDFMITASEDALVKLWEFDHPAGADLPDDVEPVLPPDAPLGAARTVLPAGPERIAFMPDNVDEQAAQLVRTTTVDMVQAFLTNLGFSSACPPEREAILAASDALMRAMFSTAAELSGIALDHFGPDATPENAMELGVHP